MQRRAIMAGIGASILAGCTKIGETRTARGIFDAAESWHKGAQRFLGGGGLVQEYPASAISPFFRGNGSTDPRQPAYQASVANGFTDWRLTVAGLVRSPLVLTMDNIRNLPQRTQITRHDCVEGWSAIGQWTGPQLSIILNAAGLLPQARFIVFRCADNLSGSDYYESVDLDDASHQQTIVAHALNGEPLPIRNGAPLRMRIERQLGYKHAKYLTRIEAVASLDEIGNGRGGYWEDRSGYQWYAGI